ncbi:MAG TPA: Crp/Fnr family transcriptional regulator [Dehalococcoidia bacterium]|nr:Crp/Fnr family transcriptional regulator [Dehalococcoidia bacterium]
MIEASDQQRVSDTFPFLATLGEVLRQEFFQKATLARLPSGRDVMAEGDRIEAIPLVLSGTIRVYRIGETGREITIYRFERGECCVLSADSILGNKLFPACAQVEDEVEVAFIPAAAFDDWLARSPAWREFVFQAMSRRLLSLLDTLDDVAFGRMDARVASLLLRRAGDPGTIQITHQEIADELGSSREVISRILEDFQSRGLIRLSRGSVRVAEPQSLAAAARV